MSNLFSLFSTGRFDASALHIAHALKQTEIQKSYNKAREKPIGEYLVSSTEHVSFGIPLLSLSPK
jgi:hypothetical protein